MPDELPPRALVRLGERLTGRPVSCRSPSSLPVGGVGWWVRCGGTTTGSHSGQRHSLSVAPTPQSCHYTHAHVPPPKRRFFSKSSCRSFANRYDVFARRVLFRPDKNNIIIFIIFYCVEYGIRSRSCDYHRRLRHLADISVDMRMVIDHTS